MIHLHLNTSNSSLRLPPGTPRLIPTHIEILPFLSRLRPRLDEARSLMTAHKAYVQLGFRDRLWPDRKTEFTTFAALRESEVTKTVVRAATNQQATGHSKETSAKDAQANGSLRLTPSSMLTAAQSDH